MKSALIISAKYNKRKVSKRRGQLEQDVEPLLCSKMKMCTKAIGYESKGAKKKIRNAPLLRRFYTCIR